MAKNTIYKLKLLAFLITLKKKIPIETFNLISRSFEVIFLFENYLFEQIFYICHFENLGAFFMNEAHIGIEGKWVEGFTEKWPNSWGFGATGEVVAIHPTSPSLCFLAFY